LAIGERRTVELAMTGRVFSVQEALQFGLVHEVAQPMEVEERATQIARLCASASPETLRRGLDFVQESRGMNWKDAGALAAGYSARTVRSSDLFEGVQAHRERRRPEWPSMNPDRFHTNPEVKKS
jgi:enoyl-CoA hydratase/carnithine racemase